jgi:phosphatidylserine/phosphatidylglycerophosphate/cardiolipin synthase-like enzyme
MRPPEIDLALLCEEAGVDPGALERLIPGVSESVTAGSLGAIFPGVGRHLVLGILSVAHRAGVIEPLAEHGMALEARRWRIKPEEFRALAWRASVIAGALPGLRELLISGETYRVAVTVPAGLPRLERFYAGFENTTLGMRRLIEEAKREAYLVAPFFDREGVQALSPSIEGAFRRGVRVSILTRYLAQRDANRRALDWVIAACDRAGGVLSLFETEGKEDAPLLHAKIVVTDGGKEAYVGSANLTGWGMERTLEVGVFVRGAGAQGVFELVAGLVEVSDKKWP